MNVYGDVPLAGVIFIAPLLAPLHETLVTVFDHSPESAEAITVKIHEEGAGTAAVLPYEMAEQKGVEVTQLARNNGFPLQIKLEPNE